MDSLINTFHIDWKIILAQVINFALVFFVLYRFALKPLAKLMKERGETIAGGLENAEKQKELLAKQQAEYDATLAKARVDAAALMKEVKHEGDLRRTEMLEETRQQVAGMLEGGRQQLEADKQKMLTEAKQELVAIVMNATEKVLGSAITEKVETKLVEESIKNI